MQIFEVLKHLRKQAYELKGYKALNKTPRILLFISLIPVIALCYLFYVMLLLGGVFLKFFGLPKDYLLKFVQENSERQPVKHASQAVIYFFGFPLVLFFTLPYILLYLMIYAGFFFFEILVYLATLGGIDYQPFLLDYKFDLPTKEIKQQKDTPQLVVSIIVFVLFIVSVVLYIIYVIPNIRMGNKIGLMYAADVIYLIQTVITFIYAVCISRNKFSK